MRSGGCVCSGGSASSSHAQRAAPAFIGGWGGVVGVASAPRGSRAQRLEVVHAATASRKGSRQGGGASRKGEAYPGAMQGTHAGDC
jgi:hypothetical protein